VLLSAGVLLPAAAALLLLLLLLLLELEQPTINAAAISSAAGINFFIAPALHLGVLMSQYT
jgi:hypothetical protein